MGTGHQDLDFGSRLLAGRRASSSTCEEIPTMAKSNATSVLLHKLEEICDDQEDLGRSTGQLAQKLPYPSKTHSKHDANAAGQFQKKRGEAPRSESL